MRKLIIFIVSVLFLLFCATSFAGVQANTSNVRITLSGAGVYVCFICP
jgi:hypothetical protein